MAANPPQAGLGRMQAMHEGERGWLAQMHCFLLFYSQHSVLVEWSIEQYFGP